MRWFRDDIGHGSWLALIALAINLALSFGHIHVIDGHRAALGVSLVGAIAAPAGGQTKGHSGDGHADHLCPICMAAAAMGNALASSPPALPLQLAAARFDRAIEAVATVPARPRAAFQSRGPPLS